MDNSCGLENDCIKLPNQLGHYARTLSDDEVKKLQSDTELLSSFKQNVLEKEARKNWDLFYKRNKTNFYKDRHWTKREFIELCDGTVPPASQGCKPVLLETGCGVGNFIFPLLEEKSEFFIHACDFSKRAIEFVKAHSLYDPSLCNAFVCDLTEEDLTLFVKPQSVDVATMIFVLSAVHPAKMSSFLKNVFKVLRPGGVVLFRDYGLYDQAMLRFSRGHKLDDHFYVRQDGTRAYYFPEEELVSLFESAGYVTVDCSYVTRQTVNKKEGISVPRIFVQGKFQKPEDNEKGNS